MLRFLSGIAIIAFTSFCGYLLSKKYRQRKLFFRQFKEFNERFLSEITYFRRPIREFALEYSYEGEFHSLLKDFFQKLEKGDFNNRKLFDLSAYHFISTEEQEMIADYFLMLGRGDSLSQKGYFSSLKDRISKLQTQSENDCKRYGELYVKIGFLCGLLILILIV